jgi:hypothetical protein
MKHTVRSSLMRTVCSRWHIASIPFPVIVAEATSVKQTDPLAVRLYEHRYSLREGLIEKSDLTQHACEGHRVGSDEARILEVENNSRCRKYKESAHMVCLTNLISQPGLEISYGFISLISNEAGDLQGRLI